MKVTGVMCLLILSASMLLISVETGSTVGVIPPVGEDTFEFTNGETEDAYDLHIEWSRAVEVKEVKPFKKKEGSGTNRTDLSNGVVKPTEKATVTVAWDGSDPEVKQWWWTKKGGKQLGEKKTGNPTSATTSITPQLDGAAKASVVTANGLHRASFDTIHGRVIVNLPDDIRAGDTISGTVVVEPKGNTKDERQNNTAKLSELKLNLGAKFPKDQKDLLILVTPGLIGDFTVDVPDSFDYTIGVNAPLTDTKTVTITINSMIWFINNQPTSSDFLLPSMGQQGRPVEILGPFSGGASNTTLRFGPPGSTAQDFEKNTESVSGGFGLIRPLAESPRKMVFEAPNNVSGPIALDLKEGSTQTIGAYRNVGVRLSAPKTNLLKGERTTLTTEVNGLQGINKPVPLTLEAKGVILMEGGMFQPLFIQPSQVGADGRYVTTREITGVLQGGWEATSTVVTQPFNIVLRDPDPPQTLVLNSFTGDYVFCGGGTKLSGTGQVQRNGCAITLTHDAPDRRVFGRLDACAPVDNSRFFTFYSPGTNVDLVVSVTDTKPARRSIYFNPLGKPAPPVQDTSAFATCP
jgi:hypothetical protein